MNYIHETSSSESVEKPVSFKEIARLQLQKFTKNSLIQHFLLTLSRADLLPAWIWKRLPIEQIFTVLVVPGKSFQYASSTDDSIGRALFWRGLKSWEPETIFVFCQLAQKANLFLDVGANTGLFTLLACGSNHNLRTIAFEPVPQVYQQLLTNIQVNGWQDRCQIRNEAVSNTVGLTKLHVPFGDMPSSASLHSGGFRGYAGSLIDVSMTTIDAVCANQIVDLVKIDVEGFEDKVLEGMQRTLAISTPTIIIECNPDGPFQVVETILKQFNYRFFHLRREGPVLVDRIVPDSKQIYRNFLCICEN